ncbi:6604_t:CDS:1 [Paraglomus occultum]|uniref:6604_t:CDS:1 n=1 Tax=Paraglomus occultum TaxID=144539 RepID=A0A9N9C2U2_9GLOM|nr:6604_t:CDS:1 [Paraglomus occultum]
MFFTLQTSCYCPTFSIRYNTDQLSDAEREREPRKQRLTEALETVSDQINQAPGPSSLALRKTFPKEQQALNFLCHRPPTHCGRQIIWYHQAFRNFVRHSTDQSIQPSKISYDASVELCDAMAKIYRGENERCQALETVLSQEFGLEFAEITLSNNSRPDGISMHEISLPNPKDRSRTYQEHVAIIIRESKNEIEGATKDPYLQATCSYSKFWSQSKLKDLRAKSNCPSMLFCSAGPWFCICGAVFLDTIIVDPLTDMIPLMPTNGMMHYMKIARVMEALKTAHNDLAGYYNALGQSEQMLTNDIDMQRFYPDVRRFKDVNGKDVSFYYTDDLCDQCDPIGHLHLCRCTKPYRGRTEDGQEIVVKFTTQYNEAAHELCAKDNLAPKLLGVKEVSKGLKVIIMEYVQNSRTLHEYKPSQQDQYLHVMEDVKRAISLLHRNGYVFGDLRSSNILVLPDSAESTKVRAVLVDFDWVGKDGEDTYPISMNAQSIVWPDGIKGGEPMQKKYDDELLKLLEKQYIPWYEDSLFQN